MVSVCAAILNFTELYGKYVYNSHNYFALLCVKNCYCDRKMRQLPMESRTESSKNLCLAV